MHVVHRKDGISKQIKSQKLFRTSHVGASTVIIIYSQT